MVFHVINLNVLFLKQWATSHNEQVTNVLFSFSAWEHTVHHQPASNNFSKCHGGIRPGLWWAWMDDGLNKTVFG